MEIRYAPTAEDWEHADRLRPRSAWNVFQFILTFAPFGLVGLMLISEEGDLTTGLVFLGIAFAIAFAGYEVPRLQRRRQIRSMPYATEERIYELDQKGVKASTSFFKVQYEWGAFTGYRETDGLFVLFSSPYQVGPWFPKRRMPPEQVAELRRLLETKLPARALSR